MSDGRAVCLIFYVGGYAVSMGLLAFAEFGLLGLIVLVIGSVVTLIAGRSGWPGQGQRRASKRDDD
jgi:hypothetical protein